MHRPPSSSIEGPEEAEGVGAAPTGVEVRTAADLRAGSAVEVAGQLERAGSARAGVGGASRRDGSIRSDRRVSAGGGVEAVGDGCGRDAFRSREPAKAFFVDVSETLNTPTVVFAGKLIARVGLATNKPAEFIVLRISQDTRALEAELAAAGG
jgi:hypothetical protein